MAITDDAGRPMATLKGFMHAMGGRLTRWGPDHATIELEVSDVILNGIGVVHGGVLGALIDTVGARAAVFCAEPGRIRRAMTISLNVNMVGNVSEGLLVAQARVRKAGKTIFVSSCDVHDGDGNLLATGEVVGRYSRGSHRPEGIEAPDGSVP